MFLKIKFYCACLVLIYVVVSVANGDVGNAGHKHVHIDLDHVENPSYSGLSPQKILKIVNELKAKIKGQVWCLL
jgi:hypothetical protein